MLMVKPGLAYLDLVRETKNAHPNHPMFIYQVTVITRVRGITPSVFARRWEGDGFDAWPKPCHS